MLDTDKTEPSLTDVRRMIKDAIARAESSLADLDAAFEALDEIVKPPVCDEKIHVDADANIAWRWLHGHKIVVSLVDADILTEKSISTHNRTAKLRLFLSADKTGVKPMAVRKGTRAANIAAIILERMGRARPNGMSADHVDRNPLNNRRSNLRWATASEQVENQVVRGTSRYFGVVWYKVTSRWAVKVSNKEQRRTVHGGYYHDETEAARAADALSLKLNGPDAKTNVKLGLLPPLTEPAQ